MMLASRLQIWGGFIGLFLSKLTRNRIYRIFVLVSKIYARKLAKNGIFRDFSLDPMIFVVKLA